MEEDEQKEQNSLFEQATNKTIDKGKEIEDKAKKKAKKKIIMAIIKNPEVLGIILAVIAAAILIVLLIVGFVKILRLFKSNRTNSSMSSAISATIPVAGAPGQTGDPTAIAKKKITIDKATDGKYTISTEVTDEELEKIKAEMIKYKLNPSKLTDFELRFLATLVDNGLNIDDYTEEEIKCLPIFLKAELCTQYLDLRPASAMYPDGSTYTPVNQTSFETNQDIVYGTVVVQRNSTDGTKTNLSYIDKATFDGMKQAANKDLLKFFTVDTDDNLIIAQWSSSKTDYTYTGTVLESEKKSSQPETYILTETKIPYKQYVSKYTMPFDILNVFLATLKNIDFAKEVAKLAFESKILIAVEEELNVTTTTTVTNYTINRRVYDTPSYRIRPNNLNAGDTISSGSELIEKVEEDGVRFTYKEPTRTYKETCIITNKTNKYNFEIIEADIWYAHYKKTYAKLTPTTTTTKNHEPFSTQGEYAINETLDTSDATVINANTYVSQFKTDKVNQYKTQTSGIRNYWVSGQEGETLYTYVIVNDTGLNINFNNIHDVKINNTLVSGDKVITDAEARYVVLMDFTQKYNSFSFSFADGNDIIWQFNTSSTAATGEFADYKLMPLVMTCTITDLYEEKWQKIDTAGDVTEIVTAYPTDPNPVTNTEIYGKDKKFLKVYDNNQKARDAMDSIAEWVFITLEENPKTVALVDVLKYLLYKYDGTNYGVTELDLSLLANNTMIPVSSLTGAAFVVKTDAVNALPTLTKEQLETAIKATYSGQAQANLIGCLDQLMSIQTDDKVNPIFAIAVTQIESSCGTNWDAIAPWTHNWMSVSYWGGTISGPAYTNGKYDWCTYNSFNDAIYDFGKYISTSSHYFTKNKYSIMEIAPTYCNTTWGTSITNAVTKLYANANVDISSYMAGTQPGNSGEGYTSIYNSQSGKVYKEYKQNIGPWRDGTYGEAIKNASTAWCNRATVCTIASAYGSNYNLVDLSSGPDAYVDGQGIKWAAGYKIDTIVIDAGLTQLSEANKTKLIDHLKTGDSAALYFSSSIQGGSQWTSSTHWVAVLDIKENPGSSGGYDVYISNPVNGSSKQGWMSVDSSILGAYRLVLVKTK